MSSKSSFNDEDDSYKAFLSRVPTKIDDETLQSILKKEFGDEAIIEASTVKEKIIEGDKDKAAFPTATSNGTFDTANKKEKNLPLSSIDEASPKNKGFAFIKFATIKARDAAIQQGSLRWEEEKEPEGENGSSSTKKSKKRKRHTMYIGPIVRNSSSNENTQCIGDGNNDDKGICYLWALGRCTHGNKCKFSHIGEGSCAPNCNNNGDERKQISYAGRMKRRKCFSFKKTGKCKAGDQCLFSHDCFKPKEYKKKIITTEVDRDEAKNNDINIQDGKKDKECINWKTKGKCRKGDTCPYRHDLAIREKLLLKKEKKNSSTENKKKLKGSEKKRQPLSVRVFGLNYDTTEEQIRTLFHDCGPIVELTFPKFEDSGRSKGFCGVLFQSPKAVEKAVALDGIEIDGRWLRIQAGKMYLRQWEENIAKTETKKEPITGEFGQKVKRRKKHGFQ